MQTHGTGSPDRTPAQRRSGRCGLLLGVLLCWLAAACVAPHEASGPRRPEPVPPEHRYCEAAQAAWTRGELREAVGLLRCAMLATSDPAARASIGRRFAPLLAAVDRAGAGGRSRSSPVLPFEGLPERSRSEVELVAAPAAAAAGW